MTTIIEKLLSKDEVGEFRALLDQEVNMSSSANPVKLGTAPGYDIDVAITPENLLTTTPEPELDTIKGDTRRSCQGSGSSSS